MNNPAKPIETINPSSSSPATALQPPEQVYGTEIRILNTALGMELAALGRYKACYFLALNQSRYDTAEDLIDSAEDIEEDIDQIIEQILQSGGKGAFNSEILLKTKTPEDLAHQQLREVLSGELHLKRQEILEYQFLLNALENLYPRTQKTLEGVLAKKRLRFESLEKTITQSDPKFTSGWHEGSGGARS